ncbi:MAG: SusE domain-containing protein [Parafilimonas sp.]
MKTLLKINAFAFVASLLLLGCEKAENKIYYEGGTPPALTATVVTDSANFVYANQNNVALNLSWTNPDYTFTTGVSSLDVTYNIEVDTLGSNFTNPSKKVIVVSKDLSYSFTVAALDDIMLNQLNLEDSMSHTLDIRVVSSLAGNSAQLASNSIQYTVGAYAIPPKVNPPPSDSLFITGSATAGNWMQSGKPESVPGNQIFTRIDEKHYTITVNLFGGQEYLFVPVRGDWSHKYAVPNKSIPNLWQGGDFLAEASDNFPGPPTEGSYKIDVDFQKGKFTVTPQ